MSKKRGSTTLILLEYFKGTVKSTQTLGLSNSNWAPFGSICVINLRKYRKN